MYTTKNRVKGEVMLTIASRKKTAAIIKKAREDMGLTQSEIAEKLGIGARAFANIENADSNLDWKHVYKLMEVFSCDIGFLTGEHLTKRREAADIQAVTGLSEDAIEGLKYINAWAKKSPDITRFSNVTPSTPDSVLQTNEDFALDFQTLLNTLSFLIENDVAMRKLSNGLPSQYYHFSTWQKICMFFYTNYEGGFITKNGFHIDTENVTIKSYVPNKTTHGAIVHAMQLHSAILLDITETLSREKEKFLVHMNYKEA